MIHAFPHFSKLHLDQKKDIESYISHFPPYSDFNFTSLWTYNTEDAIEVALLNDNLVIQFTDYITLKPFYSFLGVNKIRDTIDVLLTHSHQKKYEMVLKLVPEVVISSARLDDLYVISEDRDNHDYIVSTDEVAELPHHKYRTKKQQIAQFKKLYPTHDIKHIDLLDKKNHASMLGLFSVWEKKSGKLPEDTENELTAISRLLEHAPHFDVSALGIYDKDVLIGFTIFEVTHNQHGIYSFQKADRTYRGIFTYMCHEVAKILKEKGCTHINYEQDMGIVGLRNAKTLWKPVHYLRKYIISPKVK